MTSINGLPAHVLLVHLVVVMLPLTAALAIVSSLWSPAQRKLTFLIPLGALISLIAVPLTTASGDQLAERLGNPAFIERHERLGSLVLPWTIAFFLLTAAQWAYLRFVEPRRWVTVALAALVILSATGTAVQVALTGEAGARAVWGSLG